jgi:hypothetical protein
MVVSPVNTTRIIVILGGLAAPPNLLAEITA